MSDLNDLLRQQNVSSDQHIGVSDRWLMLRHDCSCHLSSLPKTGATRLYASKGKRLAAN